VSTEDITGVDWSRVVVSDWISRLDRMALRRFGQQVLAEEAVNHVLEKLAADNWSALSGYQGKAQPISYLNVIATHLLEEFSRSKFGRPRPPLWLKKNGELWVSIWRQVCLERQLAGQVLFNRTSGDCSRAYLENIIRVIKARMPWCGVKHREIPADYLEYGTESDESGGELSGSDPSESLDDSLEELLLVIRLLIDPDAKLEHDATLSIAAVRDSVNRLREAAALSDQELLVLRLVFIERVKQGVVAENLGLKPYQLSKQLKALMARLREGLESSGINREAFFT